MITPYKRLLSLNTRFFTFDIVVHRRWRLAFWWRDWYIQKDRKVKQRLWKFQITRIQFCYWLKH